MSFFDDLRDRRLFQITAGVVTVGWILLEAVGQLIERGLLPEVAYRVGLIWFLGGIVAGLTVGWFHGEEGPQEIGHIEALALSGLGIAVALLSASTISAHMESDHVFREAGTELDLTRVAVLYFDDLTAGELVHVADGLTEDLIDDLSGVRPLSVVSRNGALRARETELPPDSVARILDSGTLVRGSLERRNDHLRVNLRLLDGASGAEIGRDVVEVPEDELLEARRSVAERLARLLREWLGEEIRLRDTRSGTESRVAWVLFQRAERERKEAERALGQGDAAGLIAAFQRADSLLRESETADPVWIDPVVLRGRIAFRWAQLSSGEPREAEAWIRTAEARASRVLDRAPRSAAALEVRGRSRYLAWVLGLAPGLRDRSGLLAAARNDLERAVRYDPGRADAWRVLSSIQSHEPDPVEAKLAAQRALEADAFLESADFVLWSLYATSYDLEQWPDARHYCAEGRERFPRDHRFVLCELYLLASPAMDPDVDRAGELVERVVTLSPPPRREWNRRLARILLGGAMAAAGQRRSADQVLLAARPDPSVDPGQELLGIEAVFRIRMGDRREALALLKQYLTTSPDHREGWRWTQHWWWRDLRDDPEFQDLIGADTDTMEAVADPEEPTPISPDRQSMNGGETPG